MLELSVDLLHACDSAELGLKQTRPHVRRSHVESKDGCTHERAGQPVDGHTVRRAQIVDTNPTRALRVTRTEWALRSVLRVARGPCQCRCSFWANFKTRSGIR